MASVNDTSPTVAVWMVTYNHEKFIGRAIDGILNQNTDFNFKVFIGEDLSIDKTREICIQYKAKHPEKIDLLLQPENTGGQLNAIHVYQRCIDSGAEFIAQCEGDDYWIDSNKLQRQVDFLRSRPELSLCSTRFYTQTGLEGKREPDYYPELFDEDIAEVLIDLDTFFRYWLTKTMTVVFRTKYLDMAAFAGYDTLKDMHIYYHMVKQADGVCLNYKSAVYTKHAGGIWGQLQELRKVENALNSYRELYVAEADRGLPHEALKRSFIGKLRAYLLLKMKASSFPYIGGSVLPLAIEYIRVTKSVKKFLSIWLVVHKSH